MLWVPIGLHECSLTGDNGNEIVVYKMDTCISNCFENIEVITIKLETYKVNKTTNKNEKTALRARARRRYLVKPPQEIEKQNKLVNEMLIWAQKNDSLCLEDFPISKNMATTRFYACAQDNDYFADALDLARYTISSRLQLGLRNRTLDKNYVLRLLPIYNQEYKFLMFAKIAKSHEESRGFNIIMSCYNQACQDAVDKKKQKSESLENFK